MVWGCLARTEANDPCAEARNVWRSYKIGASRCALRFPFDDGRHGGIEVASLDPVDGVAVALHAPEPRFLAFGELAYGDEELLLRVADDGQGFDVSKITDIDESGRGRGVFSMKERVGLLGGTCPIKSRPGQGTTVSARVPISEGEENAENKNAGSR